MATLAFGQPGTLLIVEVTDSTAYVRDTAENPLFATKTAPTPAVGAPNFRQVVAVGDIVSVNGRPAKGTYVNLNTQVMLQPDAVAGSGIADIRRANWSDGYFEFQAEDGRMIGSIRTGGMTSQTGFGLPPPGQAAQVVGGSHSVMGGNGAFLGARGYMGGTQGGTTRVASITEDPARRRAHAGGLQRWGIYVIPLSRPEVVTISGQPAVAHASDSTPVTAARPARAGEVLTLYASGLGPTRPGVDVGQPFPASGPAQVCNSPIEVWVNGKAAEVLYAGGYPNATDRYQVNFRVPDGVASGTVSLQLGAAWILGPDAGLAVQ
ncbi:MAG TPA: hypothetical protein VFB63_33280 [Bryobacteraceae bacterium]|nr:hypothetical protein [Bryobacteraceae bacterium]